MAPKKKQSLKLIEKMGIALLIVIAIGIYVFLQSATQATLKINEIAFSLEDGVDWIEIYNPTMNNLSLEGLYLSDKEDKLTRFKIDEKVVIPSHDFVIIYCDGYRGDLANSIVTNFRIADGETVYLVDKDGSTIIDSFTVERSDNPESNTTGRFPNGSDQILPMPQHTPGAPNVNQ